MALTVALQMDPIETVNIDADSTFRLGLEAQARGATLFHYLPRHLSLKGGKLSVWARKITLRREKGNHVTAGAEEEVPLDKMDVVLLRQDPPFDMGYITNTHLLEHAGPRTLVVNDPFHVRNAPEKLLVTRFPSLMPPTLISSDPRDIKAFRAEHGDIIVKPLFGNGGAGVFRITQGDENINSLLELFAQLYRGEPAMVQRYLPEVRQGDKRIILVDGEPVGALNRVPAAGEARSNLHVGGTAVSTALSPRDLEICSKIGPVLAERGLVFVGIDVIGNYLTEINVTSPTGIQEIERFDGTNIAAKIWDAIEARHDLKSARGS